MGCKQPSEKIDEAAASSRSLNEEVTSEVINGPGVADQYVMTFKEEISEEPLWLNSSLL